MLTGLSTFLVGCVPTYEQIGIWGPVVMVILRFIQGIGIGGEWGGSVLVSMEWARSSKNRGLLAAWPQLGAPAGFFLANLEILAFSRMSADQFLSWGVAGAVLAEPRHGGDRLMGPARHPRDTDLPAGHRE